jgi:hypothetical protein
VSEPFTQKVALHVGWSTATDAKWPANACYCGMLAGAPRSANALGAQLPNYFEGVPVLFTDLPRPVEEHRAAWFAASLGVFKIWHSYLTGQESFG